MTLPSTSHKPSGVTYTERGLVIIVVKQVEELRQIYEAQNRERLADITKLPLPLGLETEWEKLQAAKAKAKVASRA